MNALEIINAVVVVLGLPTLLAACLYVGRKLQILDTLEETIREEVRPDLKEIRERLENLISLLRI